ncbi:glycosyltransferase family 4 protein [bacterium]|nr:glycosyltransferase family 4 protein [bacterium]
MRVLLLMQWFDPEPGIKGLAFAKKLRDLGNDVEVLTGFPNYPDGKIYSGYSIKFFQVEMMEGIRVMRVPLYPSHDASAFRRMLNYVSFGIASFLAGLLVVSRKDVIYACGPPVTVGVGAALISLVRRIPFVYDIQDLWPDSLGATGMFNNSFGSKIVGNICKWVYNRATHITVQSPGVRDCLIARGVSAQKITVIFNWCDEASIVTGLTSMNELSDNNQNAISSATFDVLFAGNMGKAQDMDALLEAGRLLQIETPSIRLLLLGGGIEVPRLKNFTKDKSITNVTFLPRVPMSEVGLILARAHVLLVHLKDDPLFKITIPGKTQAYLAAGKAVVMAVAGDASKLVLESDAGICAQPSNARSIADAIQKLAAMPPADLQKMGENGRVFYWANMSLDVGARRFLKVFQNTI